MSDKAPRQHLSKKAGKTLKEKRAAKAAKKSTATAADAVGQIGKR